MAGKKLMALEMPDEEDVPLATQADLAPASVISSSYPIPANLDTTSDFQTPASIPLPPIPAAPVRRVMVQLSVKAPVELVDRLVAMANATRAQKQAIIAAALDAYMLGHGY